MAHVPSIFPIFLRYFTLSLSYREPNAAQHMQMPLWPDIVFPYTRTRFRLSCWGSMLDFRCVSNTWNRVLAGRVRALSAAFIFRIAFAILLDGGLLFWANCNIILPH